MKQKQICLIPWKRNWRLFYIGVMLPLASPFNNTYAAMTLTKPIIETIDVQNAFGILNPLIRQITVNGKVQNTEEEPLAGVSVTIKNAASSGTSTGADGRFSVIVQMGSVLVFRHLGYLDQEVEIDSQQVLTVTMQAVAEHLEEVVVVGFGTQKKVNLTGSVATIAGEDLVQRPVANVGSMLQGQVPGLQVVQNSGEPGNEGVSVRIRGQGTFSGAGNNPLVLVDGVEGNLNDINPNDIESISVLKDAASASIYGSRAGNGVLLITTKTGKSGGLVVDYNVTGAIHTPTRMFDLITNSAEYMELWNEAKLNNGTNAGLYSQETIELYRNATDRVKYPNADWLDIMFNPAFVQQHNLSINGGSENTQYNFSVGYVDQPGIMKGFDYKRYNARLNLKSKINDWLNIGTNVSVKQSNTQRPRQGSGDASRSTIAQAPTYLPKLPDGRYTFKAYDFEYNNKNMVAIVENDVSWMGRNYSANLQGWIDVKLASGLNWYSKAAIVSDFDKESDWRPQVPLYNYHTGSFSSDLDVGGSGLGVTRREEKYTNLFSYLKYEGSLANGHNIGAQVGYSQEANVQEYLYGYRRDFFNNALQEIDAGGLAVQNSNGSTYEWALRSFFGRLMYNFSEKYLVEANLRYDGTSRLHPDSRWGAFPSVSAAWRISEESFVKQAGIEWLDNFKLRASYGTLGNQSININVSGNSSYPYPYQEILNYTGNYSFDNSSLSTGVAQTALANQLLTWEETKMTDIGVDLRLFNSLDVTVDWYRKTTSNILRQSQITAVVGLSAPNVNNGTMRNQGVELGVQYSNNISAGLFEGLRYSIGGNIDRFRNTVIDFGEPEIGSRTIREEGKPWDTHYMLEWIGIFQSDAEIQSAPKQYNDDTRPGDLIFKDQNGDGVVNDGDRTYFDGQYPSFEYVITGNASWKNFDFSFMFQGVQGRNLFVSGTGAMPFIQGAPPTTYWKRRWTEENPSTTVPRIYWGSGAPAKITRFSSYYLQDASYLRLKNLTLGYTLPSPFMERFGIDKARIFFSGDNLFTKTNYPGLDPERTGSGNFLEYQQNKIYAVGLNVQF